MCVCGCFCAPERTARVFSCTNVPVYYLFHFLFKIGLHFIIVFKSSLKHETKQTQKKKKKDKERKKEKNVSEYQLTLIEILQGEFAATDEYLDDIIFPLVFHSVGSIEV